MYLVFGYYNYYPSGGFDDLIYMDKDLDKIIKFLNNEVDDKIDNFQVINMDRDIIAHGDLITVINNLRDFYWDSLKGYLEESFGYKS